MKRLLSVVLALILVFSLCACGSKEAPAPAPVEPAENTKACPSDDIVILYTNDVHCGVHDNIGYEGLAAIKQALIDSGKRVLLVDAGDFTQGDIIGTVSKGEYLIEIMNQIGYTAATIGNHEFDYGIDRLKSNYSKAEFPVICCNFLDSDGQTVFKPYFIMDVNGVKLAFIGCVSPETISESIPSNFQNDEGEWIYSFCQESDGKAFYSCIQNSVDSARAEGADYVILLSHLGVQQASGDFMSTSVIENTSGIDAVIDGHSHTVMEKERVRNADGENVILTQTGTKLQNVGMMTISTDGKFDTCLISIDGISSYIKGIEESYNDMLEQVVAKTDYDLVISEPGTGTRLIRSQETNLGDLVADAFRASTDSEISMVNGGNIRDNLEAGDIKYKDIARISPFGNSLCVVEATGQQIADALELSCSQLPAEFGGFLQVSGISFTIDMSVESSVELDENAMLISVSGPRRVKDIMVGSEPIDLERTYKLASSNYILMANGNGYTCFEDSKVLLEVGPQDNQVLMSYLTDELGGTVGEEYADPYGSGRITIING